MRQGNRIGALSANKNPMLRHPGLHHLHTPVGMPSTAADLPSRLILPMPMVTKLSASDPEHKGQGQQELDPTKRTPNEAPHLGRAHGERHHCHGIAWTSHSIRVVSTDQPGVKTQDLSR